MNITNLVNLTPHNINIKINGGEVVLPASGKVARVAVIREQIGTVAGIPVYKSFMGELIGLPDPVEGTGYIVSLLVKTSLHRKDLFSPGELVRDDKGVVIGCNGLDN